jgi:hypothetical protein
MVDAASHFTALQLTASNLRNQFNVHGIWMEQNIEGEVTYERYLHDYLRVLV